MKYAAVIEKLAHNYCAHVPDLSVCVSAGTTYDETVTNIHEGAAAWVESVTQRGYPVPPPTTRVLEIEVPAPFSIPQEGWAGTKYAVVVKKQEHYYSADAPDLQVCVAVGTTYEEAVACMRGAITLFLDRTLERKASVPSATTRVVEIEVEVPQPLPART